MTQLSITPSSPIRNDQANPVTVQVSIELDAPLPTGQTPELSYLLSGTGRQPQPIALTQSTASSWSGSFTLPADAGLNAVEALQFSFQAKDDLDNLQRGIMNRLEYSVRNASAQAVDTIRLKVKVGNHDHTSPPFNLAAGATQVIPVIIGGYPDLAAVSEPRGGSRPDHAATGPCAGALPPRSAGPGQHAGTDQPSYRHAGRRQLSG